MKTFYLFSTLLATESARNSPLNLHVKVNGTLTPITKVSLSQFNYLVVKENQSTAPEFTLEKGIVSTGEGKNKKVFGIADNYLVLGKEKESIAIQLNEHSKLLNIQPYLCKLVNSTSFSGFLMSKDYPSRLLNCSPIDIYIMSVKEDSNQSGSDDIEKQEIKQESKNDNEQMDSLIGSETGVFDKRKEVRLHSRASIVDSQKAEERRDKDRESGIISLFFIFGL